MRIHRILFLCFTLSIPTGSWGANHLLPSGGGGEVQPPGQAPGFVILKQPQADHDILLRVRPVAGQGGDPADHVWERIEPAGGGYTEERTIRWSATASCAEGIDFIRITGPGGTQTQTFNGTRNAISGHVNYDSFDPDALDEVCLNWGQQMNTACANDPDGPNCPAFETFNETHRAIFRGSAPIQVSGECTNGPMPTETYRPRLILECRQAE
ncbi:MAG: hypothetical protein AAF919_08740 [Pseudomonadota bacterium]